VRGDTKESLLASIRDQSLGVGVIGLGHVGLPLALAFAEKGFRVLGFDTDASKVERLNRGEGYIQYLNPDRVAAVVDSGHMVATKEFERLAEPDALLICVPTPLTPQREPDLSYVVSTARAISESLRVGQLVVLESTTYPGTTDGLLRDVLDESGLALGRDFFLAYSPEREDPGNADYTTTHIPKVVGGVDEDSADVAQSLYDAIVDQTVRVESARAAEACKLTENVFRAVNIALVNELKVIYARMGIDVWDVLDAAATKPFGYMRFNPGPGLGGHCIPLDPFYLSWKAREYGIATRFIELAGEINVSMPEYVVSQLVRALNDRDKPVRGATVLVMGLAYKKDVDDTRESPAFEIIDELLELGAEVSYHDPHIPIAPKMRSWPHLPSMESVPLTHEVLSNCDAAVIVTDHTDVDYDGLRDAVDLVVDTRGVFRGRHPNVVKA